MSGIIKWCDRILLVLLTVYAAVFGILPFAGFTPVHVLSGSMEPAVKAGSIAYIKKTEVQNLHKNDIIAFEMENGSLILHRIQKIGGDQKITTKGDANGHADFQTVEKSQVKGKLIFALPYAGTIYRFFTAPAALAALLFYVGLSFGSKIGKKGEKAAGNKAEDRTGNRERQNKTGQNKVRQKKPTRNKVQQTRKDQESWQFKKYHNG